MKSSRAHRANYPDDPISHSLRGVRSRETKSAFTLTRTCGAAWFIPMMAIIEAPQMLLGEQFKVGFSGGRPLPLSHSVGLLFHKQKRGLENIIAS